MDTLAEDLLKTKLTAVMSHLNERRRWLLAGVEAIAGGFVGITLVAELTGMSRSTAQDGGDELKSGAGSDVRYASPCSAEEADRQRIPDYFLH